MAGIGLVGGLVLAGIFRGRGLELLDFTGRPCGVPREAPGMIGVVVVLLVAPASSSWPHRLLVDPKPPASGRLPSAMFPFSMF